MIRIKQIFVFWLSILFVSKLVGQPPNYPPGVFGFKINFDSSMVLFRGGVIPYKRNSFEPGGMSLKPAKNINEAKKYEEFYIAGEIDFSRNPFGGLYFIELMHPDSVITTLYVNLPYADDNAISKSIFNTDIGYRQRNRDLFRINDRNPNVFVDIGAIKGGTYFINFFDNASNVNKKILSNNARLKKKYFQEVAPYVDSIKKNREKIVFLEKKITDTSYIDESGKNQTLIFNCRKKNFEITEEIDAIEKKYSYEINNLLGYYILKTLSKNIYVLQKGVEMNKIQQKTITPEQLLVYLENPKKTRPIVVKKILGVF
jgi:hypothetical protein